MAFILDRRKDIARTFRSFGIPLQSENLDRLLRSSEGEAVYNRWYDRLLNSVNSAHEERIAREIASELSRY